ncbi:pyridoxal-phosphate dependent enzyme [Streptomyces sp. ODS28]|uniref:pyridoxal-phosphate dependent enzyme n=1 Tax=Streptomyces sp. ODS28 TaxID=3136688 RepID=UPI0031EF231D
MHDDAPSTAAPPWYARPAARSWRCPPHSSGVRGFHASLPGYAPTPLTELPSLATELGLGRVFVKDESARLGLPAFKALGASWAVHRALDERDRGSRTGPCTLISATDGNHGRAVARMARLLGQRAHVFVPRGVPEEAVRAIAAEGAELSRVPGPYDEAVARAAEAAGAPDALLIQDAGWPGYETVPGWIVEGYSTLCAELDEQLAAAGASAPGLVAVPVGVGSLSQAVVTHYRSASRYRGETRYRSDTHYPGEPSEPAPKDSAPALLSVEPESAACVLESLVRGERVSVTTGETAMAGLNCGTPSATAWPHLRGGLDAAVAVTDGAAARAAGDLAALGVSPGPCGAAPLAGLRAALTGPGAGERRGQLGLGPGSVAVLLSTEGADANPGAGPGADVGSGHHAGER